MSFTDGLADLQNEKGELFEDKGIEDFTNKNGHKSASEFNEALLKRIDDYRGEASFTDDIAVITCKLSKFF